MNNQKKGEENLRELLEERAKLDELMRDKLNQEKYIKKSITYKLQIPAILHSE